MIGLHLNQSLWLRDSMIWLARSGSYALPISNSCGGVVLQKKSELLLQGERGWMLAGNSANEWYTSYVTCMTLKQKKIKKRKMRTCQNKVGKIVVHF